jgi:hypothetical protein
MAPTMTQPSDASVAVEGTALRQSRESVSFGVILKNTADQDAHDVVLKGTFTDRSGTVIDGIGPLVPVIPAHTTYYWEGYGLRRRPR